MDSLRRKVRLGQSGTHRDRCTQRTEGTKRLADEAGMPASIETVERGKMKRKDGAISLIAASMWDTRVYETGVTS